MLQFYGRDYEVALPGSGASFAWRLAPPEAGRYTVQACWAAGTDRSTAAPYRFGRQGAELQAASVDQTEDGGVWVNLGVIDLEVGEPCRVELSATTDGVVIADAVRLLRRD